MIIYQFQIPLLVSFSINFNPYSVSLSKLIHQSFNHSLDYYYYGTYNFGKNAAEVSNL